MKRQVTTDICAVCGELFAYTVSSKRRKYCGLACKRTSKINFYRANRPEPDAPKPEKKPNLIRYAGYDGTKVRPRKHKENSNED